MKLKEIIDYTEKQDITRLILEALPEWFGISEARENYIKESKNSTLWLHMRIIIQLVLVI